MLVAKRPQLRQLTVSGGFTLPQELVEAIAVRSGLIVKTDLCPGMQLSCPLLALRLQIDVLQTSVSLRAETLTHITL